MDRELIHMMLYLAATGLILLVSMAAAFVYQLLGTRFQRPKIQAQEQDDLPIYLQNLYRSVEKQLKTMGFETHHFQLSQDIIAHDRSEKWSQVMVSRKTGVFAELSPASTFLDMPGVEVDFWSIAKDGTALLSLNGRTHTLLGEIPNVVLGDPLKDDLKEQYKWHIEQLKSFSKNKKMTILSATNYVRLQQRLYDGYFLNLINTGAIASTGNNQFGLTFSKAFKLMFQLLRGEKRIHRLIRAKNSRLSKKQTQDDAVIRAAASGKESGADAANVLLHEAETAGTGVDNFPVEAQVQAFLRLQSANEYKPAGLMGKMIMFALTMVLSYFAFGLVFSFNSVFILLGVITIHELGHLAAMYLFKYRDLQIFFVPLLGAAAVGKKDNVSIWRQVIVYLMGPLPGIIIGLLLLYYNQTWQAPLVYETAIIMLVINYLNLLPFMPLDGGHIVRLTIMERLPIGKLIFSAISGIAFLLGGYFLSEPALWLLALIMLLTLPISFKETSILRQLKQLQMGVSDRGQEIDVLTKLRKVFETLKLPRFNHLNFADKFHLVKSLSDVLLQKSHCSIPASISLTGLYLATLLLTPPAVLMTSLGIDNAEDTIAILSGSNIQTTKNWDFEIAAESDLDKRFELLLKAAEYYMDSNEFSRVLGYLQHAEAEANTLNKDDKFARLFHTYSMYYQGLGDEVRAETELKKAVDIGMQSSNKNYSLIASQFQALAALNERKGNLKEYESNLLTALLFAKQITRPEQREVIATIVDQLLENFYQIKDYDTAVILLQQMESELHQLKDAFSVAFVRYIHQELGWLYEAQQNSKAALGHFNTALILLDKAKKTKDDLAFVDPLEKANVLLAIAYIHFEYGNFNTAQINIEKAEKLAKKNYFTSVGQYLKSFLPDTDVEQDQADIPREMKRWVAINKAYHEMRKQMTVVSDEAAPSVTR